MEFGLGKPHCESEMDTTAWEEDEFYVELRRQILLLTADEDDDEYEFLDARGYFQGLNGLDKRNLGSFARPLFDDISPIKKIHAGKEPTTRVDFPRNVNGTGVFIPTVYTSRRRARPGRFDQRRGTHKQVGRIIRDSSFTAGLKSSSVECSFRR